ncbi:MAG: hypothetical protein KJN81_12910 [Acidimicrobiia bacterium]|nr:hypothetical protein [Acidimicrobiia bacterium]NNL29322.1 hypothetical protein [Acidimicrobiia bacterium]
MTISHHTADHDTATNEPSHTSDERRVASGNKTDGGERGPSAFSRFDGVARSTALAWALVYAYLVIVAPAPDPDVAITTAQNVLGWVLTGAILTVFAASFFGRRLAGLTVSASAVGGSVLAYNGIDCIMAGHTETMFYVMAVAGAGFVLHALARVRLGSSRANAG